MYDKYFKVGYVGQIGFLKFEPDEEMESCTGTDEVFVDSEPAQMTNDGVQYYFHKSVFQSQMNILYDHQDYFLNGTNSLGNKLTLTQPCHVDGIEKTGVLLNCRFSDDTQVSGLAQV